MKKITYLLLIFMALTMISETSEAQRRFGRKGRFYKKNRNHYKNNKRRFRRRKRWLFVVNSIARIHVEPSSFSRLVGLVKFKGRVRVLEREDNWLYIQTARSKIVGYIHKDSVMPLRKIRRFLRRQERMKLDKDETSTKGFTENEDLVAGTKGFSEQDAITAGSKGFSEQDAVSAGSKGLNKGFENDMKKHNPKYRYDLVDKHIKNGAMINPFRRLRKFRKRRKIGEYYKKARQGRLRRRRSELINKRFDSKKLRHHDGFLPSEEYYIGRTTAAYVLSKYEAYGDGSSKLEKYINNLGRVLGMASHRPEVFNGYRIIILKSDKKNAFATPGGFIFITTALLKLAKFEDEIAGVLAHEIAHVALRHPTKSINQARRIEMAKKLEQANGDDEDEGYDSYRRDVKNLSSRLTQRKAWRDSKMEDRADYYAIHMLLRLGYNPMGLVRIIRKLDSGDEVHGDPKERARNLKRHIRRLKRRFGLVTKIPPYRKKIYRKMMRNLNSDEDDED